MIFKRFGTFEISIDLNISSDAKFIRIPPSARMSLINAFVIIGFQNWYRFSVPKLGTFNENINRYALIVSRGRRIPYKVDIIRKCCCAYKKSFSINVDASSF